MRAQVYDEVGKVGVGALSQALASEPEPPSSTARSLPRTPVRSDGHALLTDSRRAPSHPSSSARPLLRRRPPPRPHRPHRQARLPVRSKPLRPRLQARECAIVKTGLQAQPVLGFRLPTEQGVRTGAMWEKQHADEQERPASSLKSNSMPNYGAPVSVARDL